MSTEDKATTWTVEINAVDKGSLYQWGSFSTNENISAPSTATFTLVDTAQTYFPAVGQTVDIKRDSVRLFKGTIEKIDIDAPLAPEVNFIKIHAIDFNQLAQRFFVAANYETDGQTLKDIVDDIVDNQTSLGTDGVVTTGMNEGPEIGDTIIDYKQVKKVFDDFSQNTGLVWRIDASKVLDFYDPSTNYASFDLDTSNKDKYRSIKIRQTREKYRNRQYFRAGTQKVYPDPERFKGDGETQAFTLYFAVGNEDTDKPLVEVDTVSKTVGIRGVDDDTAFDWYYAKGEKEITQNYSDTALSSAQTLEVDYVGQIPNLIDETDNDEVTDRISVEGGSGIYENLEKDEEIDTRLLAVERVEGLLRRFGSVPTMATVETFEEGLEVGQSISVTFTAYDVSGYFLIQRVYRRDIGEGRIVTRFDAIQPQERYEDWVEFWEKSFRVHGPPVSKDTELLVLARKAYDTLTITDDLTTSTNPADLLDETTDPWTAPLLGVFSSHNSAMLGHSLIGEHPQW
jgi:hypothetical protein